MAISGININTYQMGLEDFFENKQKHHEHGHYKPHHDDHASHNGHGYHDNGHDEHQYDNGHRPYDRHGHGHDTHTGYNRNGSGHNYDWQPLLAKINNNPKLKYALIAGVVLLLLLLIVVVSALFPFLMKILDTVSKSGLQGLLNTFLKG